MGQNKQSITALSFVVDKHGDVTKSFYDPKKTGGMASARIQLLPAIKAAAELNISTKILSLHTSHPEEIKEINSPQACLIGKMSANKDKLVYDMTMANLSAICRLKNRGSKIIVQFSDFIFSRKDILSLFYRDLFLLADHIIFPCRALQKLTLNYIETKAASSVIHDPWQISKPYSPRQLNKDEALRVIWFGSNKNVDYLINCLPGLVKRWKPERNCELTVLGQNYALSEVKNALMKIKGSYPKWKFRLVPWRLDKQPLQLESEITRAHLALIPSDPGDPQKSGVSHNRLVDAVRGGCITIASPMESYAEIPGIALLGDNISELLNNAEENYDELSQTLFTGREKKIHQFNPEKNKEEWIKFWKEILK